MNSDPELAHIDATHIDATASAGDTIVRAARILRLVGAGRAYGKVAAEFAATENADAWLEEHHARLFVADNELKDAARTLFDGEERGHFYDAKKAAEAVETMIANGEIPF